MAVTSYEVGAIFTIVNRASPVLAKIAEQLGAIDKQIAGLGTGASNMTAGMALAFGKVTDSAAAALGSMRALKTEMARDCRVLAGSGTSWRSDWHQIKRDWWRRRIGRRAFHRPWNGTARRFAYAARG